MRLALDSASLHCSLDGTRSRRMPSGKGSWPMKPCPTTPPLPFLRSVACPCAAGKRDGRNVYYRDVANLRQLPCPVGGSLLVGVDVAREQFGSFLQVVTSRTTGGKRCIGRWSRIWRKPASLASR
jgi:hypothetical protein